MNNFKCVATVVAAVTMIAGQQAAIARPDDKSAAAATPAPAPALKEGSLYLQCDGQPNNMTAGETAARLLGAVTLLGIFAKPPESPDASKRKFAAAGVTACTELIEGPRAEGNATRRIPLILARALHRIEAKDYSGAIADIDVAQHEADSAGLLANPYYVRSQGRAFGLIRAAALYRMDKLEVARDAMLEAERPMNHSMVGLISVPDYLFATRDRSDGELAFLGQRTRSSVTAAGADADRLEEFGLFADAAKIRGALVDLNRYDATDAPETISSLWLAKAAVSYALANDLGNAAKYAADAKTNFETRRSGGQPETNAAEYVECMDLYAIIDMAAKGDAKGARRLFSARSQWISPSFGAVLEVNRRLRVGASPDDLIGGMAATPEEMWHSRAQARLAEVLKKDGDNKTLFQLIPTYLPASYYESVSKSVWRTEKSKILLKRDPKVKLKTELLYLYGGTYLTDLDAYTLHAALLAKSRGKQGFVIYPNFFSQGVTAAFVSGNRGDPGLPDALFNDADDVIAQFSPLFPSPEVLSARR